MTFDMPVTELTGVGTQRKALLAKLNIHTLGDLLNFFPRYVEDRSETVPIFMLTDGETAQIEATVHTEVQERRLRSNLTLYTMVVSDDSGMASVVWFNNKFVKNIFRRGDKYRFIGKVSTKSGKREIVSPVYESVSSNLHTGRVVPIYPLTQNLHQKTLRAIMMECVQKTVGNINEYLPNDIRVKYNLCEINYALANIHFPATGEDYEIARRRLAFEELLLMQLGILSTRKKSNVGNATAFELKNTKSNFLKKLSFEFTNAQHRVTDEIYNDMSLSTPMNRLVQGDVGSGKTAVAFAAMYLAFENNMQSAIMAPTEVLAMQHYKSACEIFGEENVAVLTGSITGKAKRLELEKIASGEKRIIVGTHAIIETAVEFKNLALAVTDEQHRFGVRQRAVFAQKSVSPHILIMSATPIPRTLALILYGDLDISVVDEMPPGRQKIDTFAVGEDMRPRINKFIEKNINEGRQVYIVCPLATESEKMDLTAASALAEKLSTQVFPQFKTELLHGKMKSAEKNEIMTRFKNGETDILVSTTVIEVGVNVPNATVMIVENAERFGLSQLHQIRGRVGRGSEKSYCILFAPSDSGKASQRLEVMTKTNDGFKISEKDLELRGPGDFFGVRQHGLPEFKIANLTADMPLFKQAQNAALEILSQDENLNKPQHMFLKQRLNTVFQGTAGGNIVG